MATRFYLSSTSTNPLNWAPNLDAGWENQAVSNRHRMTTYKALTAMTSIVVGDNGTNTGTADNYLCSFSSEALLADTTISGTVKGYIRALEGGAAGDFRFQCLIKVIGADGSTVRGTLLAMDTGALFSEFDATTLTNRSITRTPPTTLSSVSALKGDRIVVELGYRKHGVTGNFTGTFRIGDNQSTDLAENETDQLDKNPWIEFSQTMTFDESGGSTEQVVIKEDNHTQLGLVGTGDEDPMASGRYVRFNSVADGHEEATVRFRAEEDLIHLLGTGNFVTSFGKSQQFFLDSIASGHDMVTIRRPELTTQGAGGATKNTVLPTITSFSPSIGATVAATDTINFSVQDDINAFRLIVVLVKYSDGTSDIVHDGSNFLAPYDAGSSRSPIGAGPGLGQGGYSYTLAANSPGWRASSMTFVILAVDTDGNEATPTVYGFNVSNPQGGIGPVVSATVPSAGSTISGTQTIAFDVTDNSGTIADVQINAEMASGIAEDVYDGAAFRGRYVTNSTKGSITNGFHFVIAPTPTGWPSAGSMTLRIVAVDGEDNRTESTRTFTITGGGGVGPQIANITPTPGTTITSATPIELDITDTVSFRRILLLAKYAGTDVYEVIHDGDAFAAHFAPFSTRTVIAGGYHFKVAHINGWAGPVTFEIFPIDVQGNEAS